MSDNILKLFFFLAVFIQFSISHNEVNIEDQRCYRSALYKQKPKDQSDTVRLALYFESLCPGCHNFIIEQLTPTFKLLSDIFTIDLVPFGNAEYSPAANGTWNFTCQHGEEECEGNKLMACAIVLYPDNHLQVPFVDCLEQTGAPQTAGKKCSKKVGLDWQKLSSCYNSTEGDNYLHGMGVKTKALNPPHTYVPWITVNGVHTEGMQQKAEDDLLKLICDLYTGTKPEECKKRRQ